MTASEAEGVPQVKAVDGSRPRSGLADVTKKLKHLIQNVKDQGGSKLYPKVLSLSKKCRHGAETFKILLLGLAAVAFVGLIWLIFDRPTPAEDADEKLRPLSQAPEVKQV